MAATNDQTSTSSIVSSDTIVSTDAVVFKDTVVSTDAAVPTVATVTMDAEVSVNTMDVLSAATSSNEPKKGKKKGKKSKSSSPVNPPLQDHWRFQVNLLRGYFTPSLKDELIGDLMRLLYQQSLEAESFVPSFYGFGLRFGKIWFSPENEKSCLWLKSKLAEINEKAPEAFKFRIEPYGLHQNKVSLVIPWKSNEKLNQHDILSLLYFQNPTVPINDWKVLKVKPFSEENRLVLFGVGNDSMDLLKKLKFKLNYGFQKVPVRVLTQNNSANEKSSKLCPHNRANLLQG